MTISLLIEILINGICQGSIYALFAIGYTMIVGVLRMVSFTHGEVIMIGAFAAMFFSSVCRNVFLCIIVCFVVAGLLGVVIHKVCYERFLDAPKHISVVCTIGMTVLLIEQNAAMALQICDHAYTLELGSVVVSGTGKELLNSEEVRKAYLGM